MTRGNVRELPLARSSRAFQDALTLLRKAEETFYTSGPASTNDGRHVLEEALAAAAQDLELFARAEPEEGACMRAQRRCEFALELAAFRKKYGYLTPGEQLSGGSALPDEDDSEPEDES